MIQLYSKNLILVFIYIIKAKELNIGISINIQSLLPFLHPFLVESVGIGVTS
jgi:hypothetical protein